MSAVCVFFFVVVAIGFFWMGWDLGNCWCKRPVQYLSFARRSCCAMHFWRIPMLGWTDINFAGGIRVEKKTRKWMNPRKQICSFGWYQSWYLDWFGEFQHLAHPKIHSSWVFCKNPRTCWPIWEIQFVATLEVKTVFWWCRSLNLTMRI